MTPTDTELQARLKALEDWRDEATGLLKEIRDAVVGGRGGKEPGLHEELRAMKERVAFLEQIVKWFTGLMTTLAAGLAVAWSSFNGTTPHR